jgi:hypothetical protein
VHLCGRPVNNFRERLLDISTQTIPFANSPSGISTSQPVSYTMSMDINIAQSGPSWRNVFNNGSHDCCDGTSRRPAMFIVGNDWQPANRVHIVHGANEDNNRTSFPTLQLPLGQWFNVTWVVNNGTLSTYFNGVPDATVTGTFNWGSSRPEPVAMERVCPGVFDSKRKHGRFVQCCERVLVERFRSQRRRFLNSLFPLLQPLEWHPHRTEPYFKD